MHVNEIINAISIASLLPFVSMDCPVRVQLSQRSIQKGLCLGEPHKGCARTQTLCYGAAGAQGLKGPVAHGVPLPNLPQAHQARAELLAHPASKLIQARAGHGHPGKVLHPFKQQVLLVPLKAHCVAEGGQQNLPRGRGGRGRGGGGRRNARAGERVRY